MKRTLVIVLAVLILIPSSAYALNEKQMEYCNINQWHSEGLTGKGVKILLSDVGYIHPDTVFINMKNIVNPIPKININQDTPDGYKTHIQAIVQIIQQIAPDAIIYIDNFSLNSAVHTAIENDVQIISRSLSAYASFFESQNERFKLAYDKGIFMNGAAGNTIFNKYAESPYWFSTGAVRLKNNKVYKEDYSQTGEGLNFMGLTRLDVYKDFNLDGKGKLTDFWGTSAATPWVSGMVALYYQYFNETYDRFPTVPEVEEFIINNCKDLQDKGYDIETGYGLFILPNIDKLEK